MRVTFDARHLQTVARVRGIGRYTRNLLAAFARLAPADVEWTLLRLRTFSPADPSPLPPHRDLATVRLRRPELSMLAIDPIALALELLFTRPDVYHAVQLSLPLVARCRTVITIHDLAPLRWPAEYLRLPHARIGHAWAYARARAARPRRARGLCDRSGARGALRRVRMPAPPRAARGVRPDAARVARRGHAGGRLPRRRRRGGRRRCGGPHRSGPRRRARRC